VLKFTSERTTRVAGEVGAAVGTPIVSMASPSPARERARTVNVYAVSCVRSVNVSSESVPDTSAIVGAAPDPTGRYEKSHASTGEDGGSHEMVTDVPVTPETRRLWAMGAVLALTAGPTAA